MFPSVPVFSFIVHRISSVQVKLSIFVHFSALLQFKFAMKKGTWGGRSTGEEVLDILEQNSVGNSSDEMRGTEHFKKVNPGGNFSSRNGSNSTHSLRQSSPRSGTSNTSSHQDLVCCSTALFHKYFLSILSVID